MANYIESFDIHNRKAALRQVLLFKFEFFEKATEDSIAQFKKDLEDEEKELKELEKSIPDVDEDNYGNITEEEWKLIDEYSNLYMSVDFNREFLLSLLEMKVVYLFKSLEVIMKKFIQIAYPKSNTKDLYQWDNMKAFFKSNDIEIAKLVGYEECTQLRKVNNAIKHDGVMTDEINRIKEFNDQTEFDHVNLEAFYTRVRPKVELFSEALGNKVEENLYDFPNDKLQKMANELGERMDEATLAAFIVKLKEKLSPDETTGISEGFDDLPF